MMKRRGFLGLVAAAPMAAPAMFETIKAQAISSPAALGLTAGDDVLGWPQPCNPAPSTSNAFFDFASWFTKVGKAEAREQSRYIGGFDPDILEMRLPLNTRVRMQRERNYQRIVAQKRDWFSQQLRDGNGVVEWFS